MKQSKKISLFVAQIFILGLVLSSCNGSRTPAQGASARAAERSITLSVWHIWPDSSTGEGATINKFISQFTTEHPNVKIEQDSSDTEAYKTKLKTAFAGGDLPDVYFSYGAGFSKPFVETGRVMRLDTEYGSDVLDRLMPETDANAWYNGGLYGLPLKMWAGTFYVNTALFDQYNLKVPATWNELIQVCNAFRAAGVQPMCLGGKDGWHIAMYFDQIALREVGVDGVNAAMNGQKKFNDPEFLSAAEKLKELVDIGGFMNGFMGLGAQEAQAEFFMGKIPMYFNGSWLTGDVQNPDNQIKDIVLPYPFPAIPGGKGDGTYTGGAIDIWSVSNDTDQKEMSLLFMRELCEFMSIEGYKAGDGIAVWKNNVSPSELNPVLNKINSNLETAKGYSLAWDTQLSGADIDTYLKNLQALAGGQLSPKMFVDALQQGLSVAMK
jgi:raffinose/stachyose/melibiose transport system substrate-binding protein